MKEKTFTCILTLMVWTIFVQISGKVDHGFNTNQHLIYPKSILGLIIKVVNSEGYVVSQT
ncbi:hypothetical protein QE390_002110 [Siphonobacter sp. SORGH_AS 1065]|nr:hypothetical protein [Siphonobacter sp. SORGH_AS_1065]